MTDIFTPEKRSWVMSRIRGSNTKIDLKMKRLLSENRYKFEMYPKMYGNPDFILKRKKIAIFCDGDFWHGYRYHEKKKPAKKYWKEKIEGNMRRDQRYSRKLRREGWSVLRLWEHDIEKNHEKCMRKIKSKFSQR
ncbi:MAG: DNA mismatch endonuclease Vsr [Candidatus Nitrosopelagicus sp.]|jgi:DNA mismatch endonuclease (patch repair protein)|nr:DNA mismatch endonuclease Vsr [Candidatus Nitrosopelagicus sp.]